MDGQSDGRNAYGFAVTYTAHIQRRFVTGAVYKCHDLLTYLLKKDRHDSKKL